MDAAAIKNFFKRHWLLLTILAFGLLVRLAVALPGICDDPALRFSRPDTPGYLGPARALVCDNAYLTIPGGVPDTGRAPGFPFFASLVFRIFGTDNAAALALALVFVNALTVLIICWAGAVWFGRRAGLWAAGFAALNLTMIAQAPMLLSDTLFGLLAALQFGCFGLFYRSRKPEYFVAAAALAALGTLVRPINSAWILPGLFLLAVAPYPAWRMKLATGVAALGVFLVILLPWMGRNAALGAGWSIDTNTGAMYHQNGAMLLARVNGTSFEEEKAKILAGLDREFSDRDKYPDEASRTEYRLRKFRELIFAHPLQWLPQHFRPQILLPDAPTFFEILGVTSAGRGTMDVMQKSGVWAAVKHYFGGHLWVLLPVLPLLAITLVMYLLAAGELALWCRDWRKSWYLIFVFLAFAEYYFFLPGPIVAPRYQLPALPLLAAMAGVAVTQLQEKMGTTCPPKL